VTPVNAFKLAGKIGVSGAALLIQQAEFTKNLMRCDNAGLCFPSTNIQRTNLGTKGNDILIGTLARDMMVGRGGNDLIKQTETQVLTSYLELPTMIYYKAMKGMTICKVILVTTL
jgi:hypothetical protein